ncbi:UDP-glucose 4-epimerase GalE [Cohnella boryungensis]|uniref:UDP-glucose 4-epimerase n=1 Tax=Cohnella boryungensis TaxID=768479 RepID=A0ABV8S6D2_9BACL
MAVLVTGGAGFIGSHTCVALLNSGYEVVVIDNFSNGSKEALRRVRRIAGKDLASYEGDILDRRKLSAIFAEHEIEAVIHLAGLKAVGESVSMPLPYYSNNVSGTLALLETMQHYQVKRLVFSSSATVYGILSNPPAAEGFPLQATNPYGRTKLIAEELLRDLHSSDGEWSIALLRYFNPVGAHSSGLIGEDPSGIPGNLLPYISQVAHGRLRELQIFGDNYPTRDGTGVRDFIHVMDLAAGHVKALEKISSSRGVEAYNLGTGKGVSVLEMVRCFERASGRTISYRIVGRRPGDVAVCYADPSKAERELGWTATRGVEEMCSDAWRWQTNNPNGYGLEQEKEFEAS